MGCTAILNVVTRDENANICISSCWKPLSPTHLKWVDFTTYFPSSIQLYLLGYNAVLSTASQPMFRKNMLPSSFWSKNWAKQESSVKQVASLLSQMFFWIFVFMFCHYFNKLIFELSTAVPPYYLWSYMLHFWNIYLLSMTSVIIYEAWIIPLLLLRHGLCVSSCVTSVLLTSSVKGVQICYLPAPSSCRGSGLVIRFTDHLQIEL